MFMCRVFGHRYRFSADQATLRWQCDRGCGAGGSKSYPTATEATKYATAFDRSDIADLGRRAPWLGMFPLRLARMLGHRRRS